MNHVQRQRMNRARLVQADDPSLALDTGDYIGSHFTKSRPMIIRITWLVPSRIECTRKSRQKRSMG